MTERKTDKRPRAARTAGDRLRRVLLWVAATIFLASAGVILYDTLLQPAANRNLYADLYDQYEEPVKEPTEENKGNYPEGMLPAFASLYDQNPQVKGWLSYHAEEKDFLKIEYPVMYSGDNEKYLKRDFTGKKNKNGALYFDMRHTLETAEDQNKVLIVYGHNMASGQMFAGLNKMIGHVGRARTAPTLTLSTLFEESEYKVFAVILTDEDEQPQWRLNVRRSEFTGDADFLAHVEQLRAHSLFDYPVDVEPEDQLLVLSTCTAPSQAVVKDGRLLVVARKVRPGETETVDTARIKKNKDVIMPSAWYTLQDKALHTYYTQEQTETTRRPAITTTTVKDGTTAASNDE